MKTLNTKREITVVISVLIILLGILLAGIGGLVAAMLFISITGTMYGLFKKEKRVWKPFLIAFATISIAIILFTILLLNSNM